MSPACKGTGKHVMKPFNFIDIREKKEVFLEANLEQLRHVKRINTAT